MRELLALRGTGRKRVLCSLRVEESNAGASAKGGPVVLRLKIARAVPGGRILSLMSLLTEIALNNISKNQLN